MALQTLVDDEGARSGVHATKVPGFRRKSVGFVARGQWFMSMDHNRKRMTRCIFRWFVFFKVGIFGSVNHALSS